MKTNLIILVCVATAHLGWAQDQISSPYPQKPRYSHQYLMGAAIGESTDNLSASVVTIQGISYRKFNFGVGVGFDGYDNFKAFPLFGSMTYHFPKYDIKNVGFYVQFNAGHSFARPLNTGDGTEYDKSSGGVMINPMLGYRFHKENLNAFIQMGYKYQRIEQSFEQTIWTNVYSYHQKYTFERLFLQIGFGF